MQGCTWCEHMWWGGWAATLLIWILVVALIVGLILVFMRRRQSDDTAHRRNRAEDALRELYAPGEMRKPTDARSASCAAVDQSS